MRLPPAVTLQEAPAEELPGRDAQAGQTGAADLDRHDARGLLDDALDAQPVAGAADARDTEAEADQRAERDHVEGGPVHAGGGRPDELGPVGELVAERERDR